MFREITLNQDEDRRDFTSRRRNRQREGRFLGCV
ncbi:hypothetical protein T01_15420 [Trichinella spiralis]|uniref:Uncharacterized protein n=1 Tax=Trichinella spiralis TaxID=6334 RepID=A0A0V0YQV0_TRISP|nr:hypothetical protein T01_15420 [Trichinella spiralis]